MKEEIDIWSDDEAVIIRKPKRCDKLICPECGAEVKGCGRSDMSLGDWIYQVLNKLQDRHEVVIKANPSHFGTLEEIEILLKIVGVLKEGEPKWIPVELKYYGKMDRETFKTVSKAQKFKKLGFLRDASLRKK